MLISHADHTARLDILLGDLKELFEVVADAPTAVKVGNITMMPHDFQRCISTVMEMIQELGLCI